MLQTLPQLNVSDDRLARRIVTHWQEVLEDTDVVDEPFQHFFSDRIWPDDVFDMMLRFIPSQKFYRPLNIKQWVNKQGVSTRDKCYLSENIDNMEEEQAEFWRQIVLALTSVTFKRLVFTRFKRDVSLRLGVSPEQVDEVPVYVGVSLTRDLEDYRLKPHTDGQPRVVTAQFYLPEDASQKGLGTSIYTRTPLASQLIGKRFREIKRMPFLPNSGYAFAVNNLPERRSYHGRELIQAGSGVRNSILMTWLNKNATEKRATLWPIHHRI